MSDYTMATTTTTTTTTRKESARKFICKRRRRLRELHCDLFGYLKRICMCGYVYLSIHPSLTNMITRQMEKRVILVALIEHQPQSYLAPQNTGLCHCLFEINRWITNKQLSHSLWLHVCQMDLHSRTKQAPLKEVARCDRLCVVGLLNARIWHHRTFKRLKRLKRFGGASFEQN